jgi:hypothetical protein
MISFRFHVVSITAVFLAIAIGVVVGTTYVDGAVVDGLQNRIDSVEKNLDDLRAEKADLEGQVETARGYIDSSSDFAVSERLTDVPVLVLAVRGIDESAVERTLALARRAGATAPGVVWLESGWSLEDDDARADLAEIVGRGARDRVEDLWADAWEAVAGELAAAEEVDPLDDTTEGAAATTQPDPAADVLAALVDSGFLTVDPLGDGDTPLTDLAGTGPRVLVVTGARAAPEVAPLVTVIVEAATGDELPTVVSDVYVDAPEAPGRAEALRQSLSDDLRERIVLVDAADRIEGQVASILALGVVVDSQLLGTHFGYGDGAASVLPSWTRP